MHFFQILNDIKQFGMKYINDLRLKALKLVFDKIYTKTFNKTNFSI